MEAGVSVRTVASIRAALKNGKATIGSWMQIPDESVAELLGSSNFDWIALDLEHGQIGGHQLPSLFRAIEAGGTLPFARVGQVSAYAIKSVMDSGACGLILPMIESEGLLRDAVAWAHYPPRGCRGVGYSRANQFGKNFDAYLGGTNPIIVAQIEHIRAVENIDAIMSVPGLDAVMVGPYDLSASMGCTGQFDHPNFKKALARVADASRVHNVSSGVHVVQPEPERLRAALDEGHRFIAYGVDAVFLWKNARIPDIDSGLV